MIVLLQKPDGCVRPADVRPAHRLLARLLADRLTRELASGRSPDSSTLHALCAQALVQPFRRIELAHAIVETVHAAVAGDTSRQVPVRWGHVRLVGPELLTLADDVQSRGPVSARGMAMVHVLVTDGAELLFYARSPNELVTASNAARLALDPSPVAG